MFFDQIYHPLKYLPLYMGHPVFYSSLPIYVYISYLIANKLEEITETGKR